MGACWWSAWRNSPRKKNGSAPTERSIEFEKTLTDDGLVLVKFWIHISKKEQLDRFKKREKDPWKNWKLTEEDWRNREKWDAYIEALEEMFAKTDTDCAPWTIIEGNWKWWARIKALKTVVNRIEAHI